MNNRCCPRYLFLCVHMGSCRPSSYTHSRWRRAASQPGLWGLTLLMFGACTHGRTSHAQTHTSTDVYTATDIHAPLHTTHLDTDKRMVGGDASSPYKDGAHRYTRANKTHTHPLCTLEARLGVEVNTAGNKVSSCAVLWMKDERQEACTLCPCVCAFVSRICVSLVDFTKE